jgi:BirA family biotin operon repressor/biotin-[acetyl-CoA-carboxylase] ligase
MCYAGGMEHLDEKRISALLALPEVRVEVYETLPSTGDACRRALADGARSCLVLAEQQTGGRGRRGRSFYSPPGGLYMSVAFPAAPDELGLTCRAGVVTAEAVEAVTGRVCGIKWVNDLLWRGKKVCGILAEVVGAHVIVGIGVNLTPAPLPPELAETVGFLDCGDVREALAAEIARGLLRRDVSDRGFLEAYRARSIVLGREISCITGERTFPARALEIDDTGALVVEGPQGRETLRWGEVSIRI